MAIVLDQRFPLRPEKRLPRIACNSIPARSISDHSRLHLPQQTHPLSRIAFLLLAGSIVLAAPAISALEESFTAPLHPAQASPAVPPAAVPALHRRAEGPGLAEQETETRSSGHTTLPPQASGQYLLGEDGESIEIDLEPDRLSGYVSRFGDRAADQGEPLTFFISRAVLDGQRLSFLTRQVHGEWLSFSGVIVRGEARSRAQQGYYRLEGRLVRHDSLHGTEQSREVSLPLAREYLAPVL